MPSANLDQESRIGLGLQVDATATADVLQAQQRATSIAAISTDNAGLLQAEADATRLQAQQTATADILQAQLRATAHAAASTQAVAQTQVQIGIDAQYAGETATADILLAQARATANAAASTQSAGATLTQQSTEAGAALIGTAVAGTSTAIAQTVVAGTQAVIATAQRRAEQVQADAAEQARTVDFLWNWGPILLVVALLIFGVWAFWHWEVRRRRQPPPTFEPRPPVAPVPPPIRQPLEAPPEAPGTSGRMRRIRGSNDPVNGWLADIKRKLLTGEKDPDDHANE